MKKDYETVPTLTQTQVEQANFTVIRCVINYLDCLYLRCLGQQ